MYLTIEGLDGSGKTMLSNVIANKFQNTVQTTEPWDDNFTGMAVRKALKTDTAPMTDIYLFFADRSEHLDKVVKPALEDDKMVISDRGHDSSFAYQSPRITDELTMDPFDWIEANYSQWNLEPDLTLYLDIPVETALERCDGLEKYEVQETLTKVRANYERLNERFDDRFVRIDATKPKEQVAEAAFEIING